MQSGAVSELEGSDGLRGPRWSPDGRYLAAHSTDHRRLLLFDWSTGRWTELAETEVLDQYWSGDGSYLHIRSEFWRGELSRVRIRDGAVEPIATVENVRWAWGVGGMWVGFTPDGSPLLLRDLSIHHIYALDWNP